MFEICMYAKASGEVPVQEHLDSLPLKMQIKVIANIKRLEIMGNELREPYTKPLGGGIFELRTQFAGDIERVLFFFVEGEKIVLTHGFIKKTQKTPPSEIRRAKEWRQDYLQR